MENDPVAKVLVDYANQVLHLRVENERLIAELERLRNGEEDG